MRFVTEFRNPELARGLIGEINRDSHTPARFMEFCGGHTVAIFKYGIREALPKTLDMVSGPGCPVCVTATSDLDRAIALAGNPKVIIATFGDMIRVPGSRTSLDEAKATGASVHTVYSTLDALELAKANPDKAIVFLGVGFETTAPTVAASILHAQKEHLTNYYVLSLHKLCPPAIRAILEAGEVKLSGLICPGHVSAIIGARPWEAVARDYHIPCVISGFEPVDILQGVSQLVAQVEQGEARVEIAYRRGVRPEGNLEALRIMDEVFEPCSARWRGLGEIPNSGLKLRKKFETFDAGLAFDITTEAAAEPIGCLCGEVLRGVKTPEDCALFAKNCTPEHPVGPCMVSTEGCCAAHYRYGGSLER